MITNQSRSGLCISLMVLLWLAAASPVQAPANAGYSFNESSAVSTGYRILLDNDENGNFKFDAKVHGPMTGFTFRC